MDHRKSRDVGELKRIHARRRFKGCVYLVMANLFWLEDVDEESLGEDVKKNVMLLLKKKKDKKSLLTLYDKTILCKKTEERTEQEKAHLYKIIGNLKCFRKYPMNVKMQLAAACHFVYYPAGRVIVRQNREGHSLYFIMSGEVAVSIMIYDPILNEHKTIVVGTMVAGQMFGEVSLLHDIPRTATITTISHCELIVLEKEDFNKVLKKSLQAVWDQILHAMARFRYFDGWDEVSRRECCIYSKIYSYRHGDIVYGDGSNRDTYVHFLLKGTCRCIEELPVVEIKDGQRTIYKLFDRDAYNKEIQNAKKLHRREKVYTIYNVPVVSLGKSKMRRDSDYARRKSSVKPEDDDKKSTHDENADEIKRTESAAAKTNELKRLLGIFEKEEEQAELPKCVTKIFMQVCLFNELACFGLGEDMKSRKIVAATDHVECLLIPKFWLWSKNKGNVFTRIVQTLNRQIPNSLSVFHTFLENRKWGREKRELVNHIAKRPPANLFNNVPFSIRLENDINYGLYYA